MHMTTAGLWDAPVGLDHPTMVCDCRVLRA